ncbi:uncharacterized protein LOC127278887 [Leptopilina boulardi]|uniref:uncharacterized protein LOC127278887 n=1 Tax=Leptopilina boulardi TaxID=63433 RepID=UPI0021F57101|nr:uncharacterized protein LOC127278887 [Leptopilina boulardi]
MDVWQSIKTQRDSQFVKDLAEIIWGTTTLQKRCLDSSKLTYDKERKQLTPEKCKIIINHLQNKVTESKVTGCKRLSRVNKFWSYMTEKIYDSRRKLNFTSVEEV